MKRLWTFPRGKNLCYHVHGQGKEEDVEADEDVECEKGEDIAIDKDEKDNGVNIERDVDTKDENDFEAKKMFELDGMPLQWFYHQGI